MSRRLVILTDAQYDQLTKAIDNWCDDMDEMRGRLGPAKAEALRAGAVAWDKAPTIPKDAVVMVLSQTEAKKVRGFRHAILNLSNKINKRLNTAVEKRA